MSAKVKRLLCLLASFAVLFLSSCGHLTYSSNTFEPLPIDYFGYIRDETPDCITVSGEMLTADSCRVNIRNSGEYNYSLGYDYGLYKLVKNEWLPVKKKLEADSCYWDYSTIKAGSDKDFIFDWSYEYGRLVRGSYKLVTYCMTDYKGYTEFFNISWDFIMPARNLPEENPNPYGYGGKASELEDLTMTAERISPHRFQLSIINNLNTPYTFDRTFALYKKSGGMWLPVKPEADQAGLCYSKGYPGRDNKYTMVLSCYYGDLSAGDYLIVKRGMPRDEAHDWPPTDWRNRSVTDFTYVSAEFHLDEALPDADYDAEPHDWDGYVEDTPGFEDISAEITNLSASGCIIKMHNSGSRIYQVAAEGWSYYIYRLCGDEWLPVKIQNYVGWAGNEKFLYPGKKAELDLNWSRIYGRLQPGTYRLVRGMSISNGQQKITKKSLLKSFEFKITEEMAAKKENPFGYSATAEILEGYAITMEQINSHRYKLTVTISNVILGMNIQKTFALYKLSGVEWLPMPCKYETDDYYYIEDGNYYGIGSFAYGSYIIDITALYPGLEPGSYRIAVRGDSPGRYKYITADIDYQP